MENLTFDQIPQTVKSHLVNKFKEGLEREGIEINNVMINGLAQCYEFYTKGNSEGFKIYNLPFDRLTQYVNKKINNNRR